MSHPIPSHEISLKEWGETFEAPLEIKIQVFWGKVFGFAARPLRPHPPFVWRRDGFLFTSPDDRYVMAERLVKAEELNGKIGVRKDYEQKTGRFKVKFPGEDIKLIKKENLRFGLWDIVKTRLKGKWEEIFRFCEHYANTKQYRSARVDLFVKRDGSYVVNEVEWPDATWPDQLFTDSNDQSDRFVWAEHFISSSLNYSGDEYRGFLRNGQWKKKISQKILLDRGQVIQVLPGKANFEQDYHRSGIVSNYIQVSKESNLEKDYIVC